MSSVTVLQPASTPSFPHKQSIPCHQCGADISYAAATAVAEDAQRRITELEQQVRILTGKATAAVDKLADYEDQLHQLRSSQAAQPPPSPLSAPTSRTNASARHPHPPPPSRPSSTSALTSPHPPPPPPQPPSTIPPHLTEPKPRPYSRLTNLLHRSTSTSTLPPSSSLTTQPTNRHPSPIPTTTNQTDLLTLLSREQALRLAAEKKSAQTNDELEELSAQLFTEANEMVAAERKARAALEERVKVLERRDREKRERLGVLEGRLGRIERVRGMLGGNA
ncbi:MAG: hypothetical protein OHK93_008782 [Ramalina farinacea]|uniref:GDP/GTP exchange factor Sec2 N-terminal domain-containing protein n=1 Tax=Ramalina farinacea TaxID=258253 RepID=A0AA43QRE1_9LECA|nr:hypothetical protein [Ramalina farinacea]